MPLLKKVEALDKARGATPASVIEVKQLQSTTWIWTYLKHTVIHTSC